MESRCFENTFPEFDGKTLLDSEGKLSDGFRRPIQKTIDQLLNRLHAGLMEESDEDYSVYTGFGGISLLHLHLYRVYGQNMGHLDCAMDSLTRPLRRLKGTRISFLCGDAGPLALAAVIYSKQGNSQASCDCIKKLEALHKQVCEDPSLPDELLYGPTGYLYALLFVKSHLGEGHIDNTVVEKVYMSIIESETRMSQEQGWQHPLKYACYENQCLGAAHGLAGIFFMLMQLSDKTSKKFIEELVRPSIEYMLTLRFPSGNCPFSIGSTGDKLIHWCHGAPGWIHMFIQAYKLFNEDRYLQAALDCGNVIWSRGLLTKGYGICHGVAGNAYAFLALYQLTADEKHLYRAYKFAEWCCDYGHHGCRRADRPFSLFEGLAGTIYFLADMLDPKNAKFPAFYLP